MTEVTIKMVCDICHRKFDFPDSFRFRKVRNFKIKEATSKKKKWKRIDICRDCISEIAVKSHGIKSKEKEDNINA